MPDCISLLSVCHQNNSPGLAWDAMLKRTGISLEQLLLTDIDMLLMFKDGIRGGVDTCGLSAVQLISLCNAVRDGTHW